MKLSLARLGPLLVHAAACVPAPATDPLIRECLRFILGREGQHCVQHGGKYLLLTAEVVGVQLKKLDRYASVRPHVCR